jgi:hypothetical protein
MRAFSGNLRLPFSVNIHVSLAPAQPFPDATHLFSSLISASCGVAAAALNSNPKPKLLPTPANSNLLLLSLTLLQTLSQQKTHAQRTQVKEKDRKMLCRKHARYSMS